MAILRLSPALAAVALAVALPAGAQDDPIPVERPMKPPVALTFTPPDLSGDVVMGIFDSTERLVRTLRFEPGTPELKIDTNGYIVTWDGRNEAGNPCPAGRYAARGYVVGEAVAVSGEAFHFNDWMAEDRIPATGVELCRWPDALGVKISTADKTVFARIRPDGFLEPTEEEPISSEDVVSAGLDLAPPPIARAAGRDGSAWLIVADGAQNVVTQLSKDGATERTLRVAENEPQPVQILASPSENEILLRETGRGGLERVRLLRRVDVAAAEGDGRVVADWEVVFERTRQPCALFGVVDGRMVADAGETKPASKIRVALTANALHPGPEFLTLEAFGANPGSALGTSSGLALLEISGEGAWSRFAVVPEKGGRSATLYQGDGLVVEQFTVTHLDRIAAFDAGSFLLAPER